MDKDINKKIKINNDDDYKMVKDILFIREIDEENINKSLFEINFDKLSESKQDVLEYKYRCEDCFEIVKNGNPFYFMKNV